MVRSSLFSDNQKQIADLAIKHKLPSVNELNGYVEAGGLMSYSVNSADSYRRAAFYIDKILKGAKPADLPVEQPTNFELVINLKTAKQIGVPIPPNMLARAARVIKWKGTRHEDCCSADCLYFRRHPFAEAQQPIKIPRVGFIRSGTPNTESSGFEAFRNGLRELGYIAGHNITIEYRSAGGNVDRLAELAAELVQLRCEVIVGNVPVIRAARKASNSVALVLVSVPDPGTCK
jgi:ABC-type uncharacterized transport system substrate-binding protein